MYVFVCTHVYICLYAFANVFMYVCMCTHDAVSSAKVNINKISSIEHRLEPIAFSAVEQSVHPGHADCDNLTTVIACGERVQRGQAECHTPAVLEYRQAA